MSRPVEVRLRTQARDEILGERCRGLTFRKTADGGYAGGTLTLVGRWQDWEIGPGSHVYAYDARDGDVLWEGYLDNPGQTFDVDGETFDIGAQGAQTLVGDRSEILVYLDSSFEHYRSDDHNDARLAPTSQADVSAWPDTEKDAVLLQFASGAPIAKGSEARAIHDLCDTAPMGIAGFSFLVKCGIDSSGYVVQVTGSYGVIETLPMQTATQYATGLLGLTFDQPFDLLKLRLRRTAGATNIGTDRIWAGFAEPYIVGRRFDLQGRDQLDAQSNLTVIKASNVVRDLVYRMMPMIDRTNSVVESTGFAIDQLCYADPARATGVLDDLKLFEPDMVWLVGESNISQLHSFTYKEWPTRARYEISVADGYEAPGGEADLCNEITIGWVDRKGREKATKVTADVPELGGRVRAADKVDLDESVSSANNAQRIGEQILQLKNNPAKSATATIARPVWDIDAGCWIPPYKMEPGECVLVREAGETQRLTEVEFNTNDYNTSLTLGTPAPTIEQLVARLSRSNRRVR